MKINYKKNWYCTVCYKKKEIGILFCSDGHAKQRVRIKPHYLRMKEKLAVIKRY